jgi:hypothetical protein
MVLAPVIPPMPILLLVGAREMTLLSGEDTGDDSSAFGALVGGRPSLEGGRAARDVGVATGSGVVYDTVMPLSHWYGDGEIFGVS